MDLQRGRVGALRCIAWRLWDSYIVPLLGYKDMNFMLFCKLLMPFYFGRWLHYDLHASTNALTIALDVGDVWKLNSGCHCTAQTNRCDGI